MNVKKNIYSHPGVVIATLAIVFLSILLFFYLWATGVIVVQLHRSLISTESQSESGFNISGASKLDLRGLLPPSGSSTVQQ